SFIGSNFAQIPSPDLSRKVPSPLSAETPAPVRTKMRLDMPGCPFNQNAFRRHSLDGRCSPRRRRIALVNRLAAEPVSALAQCDRDPRNGGTAGVQNGWRTNTSD